MSIFLSMLTIALALMVKGITGFGSGLVTVTLLTLIWGPREAIFMSACTEVVACSILLPEVWRDIRLKLLGAIVVPLSAGIWLGTGLLTVISDDWLTMAVGTMVAISGIYFAIKPVAEGRGELDDLPEEPGLVLGLGAFVGFFGGILGGLTTASGPPIIIYGRYFFTDRFGRAQFIGIFAISSCTILAMLLWRGVVQADVMWRLPWLLPPLVLGAILGAWLSPKLSRVQFGRLVGIILAAAGAALLVG